MSRSKRQSLWWGSWLADFGDALFRRYRGFWRARHEFSDKSDETLRRLRTELMRHKAVLNRIVTKLIACGLAVARAILLCDQELRRRGRLPRTAVEDEANEHSWSLGGAVDLLEEDSGEEGGGALTLLDDDKEGQ